MDQESWYEAAANSSVRKGTALKPAGSHCAGGSFRKKAAPTVNTVRKAIIRYANTRCARWILS